MNNFDNSNVIGDLNLVMAYAIHNQNLSLLEKLRWLYIKTGNIFSYDFRVVLNHNSGNFSKVDFNVDEIKRFQTCVQISEIFNIMLNSFDPENCKANIITRKIPGRREDVEHVANEVILSNGEKYILDLTLDLYLIQSGCQTKEFGFTSNANNDNDIIPLSVCEKIDEKLGFISDERYTDQKIHKVRQEFLSKNFSNMTSSEIFKKEINLIRQKLMVPMVGPHEAKIYVNKLINDIIIDTNLINVTYRDFNLAYRSDENAAFLSCYCFNVDGNTFWYTYSINSGLIECDLNMIANLLNGAWVTNSETLKQAVKKC